MLYSRWHENSLLKGLLVIIYATELRLFMRLYMKVIAVFRKSNSLVYVRVMFGRDKDVKVSTSMHIDPIY